MKNHAVKPQVRAKDNTARQMVQDVVQSPGQALDAESLAFFEPRFGHDFSHVRVHRDASAAQSARAIHALAYAAGPHIVLRDGAPSPRSIPGRELLAHELAHVVQQSSGLLDVPHGTQMTLRPVRDPFEEQADQTVGRVLTSPLPLQSKSIRPLPIVAGGPLVVQRRAPDGEDDDLDPSGSDPHVRNRKRLPIESAGIDRSSEEREQREKAQAARTAELDEVKKSTPDVTLRKRILKGEFKDDGAYEYGPEKPFRFTNPELQSVFRYFQVVWASSVPLRSEPAKGSFDSYAKTIAEHPEWVKEFTEKLLGQQSPGFPDQQKVKPSTNLPPQWNEDSRLAQRLIEAYLRAWDKKINNRDSVNANLGEMYAAVGFSETNDRARLRGGDRSGTNWCGPASQNAIALALMKTGYRFRQRAVPGVNPAILDKPNSYNVSLPPKQTEKDTKDEKSKIAYLRQVAVAFRTEVTKQGAFFLTNWAPNKDVDKQKGKDHGPARTVSGKAASTEKLFPGDFIYIINGNTGSPLSGHVATVIKEEPANGIELGKGKTDYPGGTVLSKLYWVSGNSRGVVAHEGGIRPEVVIREMPHSKYEYFVTAAWGNDYDKLLAKEKVIKSQGENKFGQKLLGLFAPVDAKIMQDRRSSGEKAGKAKALLGGAVTAQIYFNANKYSVEAMRPLFAYAGTSFSEYEKTATQRNTEFGPRMEAAQKDTGEYVAEMRAKDQPFSRREDRDPTYAAKNVGFKGEENTGRFSPLIADHSWVVSIVRSGRLDVDQAIKTKIDGRTAYNSLVDLYNALGGSAAQDQKSDADLKQALLDELGLEPMPAKVEDLWPGALSYWEGYGAFD
jgi:Domain of unknown function (DUF4157)